MTLVGFAIPPSFEGQPPKSLLMTFIPKIKDIRNTMTTGYHRTGEILRSEDHKVTDNDVAKIFAYEDWFNKSPKISKKPHDAQYTAQYVNQIWHTDLE
jgi:hypothetical protein